MLTSKWSVVCAAIFASSIRSGRSRIARRALLGVANLAAPNSKSLQSGVQTPDSRASTRLVATNATAKAGDARNAKSSVFRRFSKRADFKKRPFQSALEEQNLKQRNPIRQPLATDPFLTSARQTAGSSSARSFGCRGTAQGNL